MQNIRRQACPWNFHSVKCNTKRERLFARPKSRWNETIYSRWIKRRTMREIVLVIVFPKAKVASITRISTVCGIEVKEKDKIEYITTFAPTNLLCKQNTQKILIFSYKSNRRSRAIKMDNFGKRCNCATDMKWKLSSEPKIDERKKKHKNRG